MRAGRVSASIEALHTSAEQPSPSSLPSPTIAPCTIPEQPGNTASASTESGAGNTAGKQQEMLSSSFAQPAAAESPGASVSTRCPEPEQAGTAAAPVGLPAPASADEQAAAEQSAGQPQPVTEDALAASKPTDVLEPPAAVQQVQTAGAKPSRLRRPAERSNFFSSSAPARSVTCLHAVSSSSTCSFPH